jgi:hypothetical protein
LKVKIKKKNKKKATNLNLQPLYIVDDRLLF